MHRANRDEDSLEIYLSLLVWKVAAMGLALSIIRTPDRTERFYVVTVTVKLQQQK